MCERGRAGYSLKFACDHTIGALTAFVARREADARVVSMKLARESDRVDCASLTKLTCPLTKGETKNVDLAMVPRYVRDWPTARASSIRECLHTSRSLCLPLPSTESGPNLRTYKLSKLQGTNLRSRYARPRISSKRIARLARVTPSNRDTLNLRLPVFR